MLTGGTLTGFPLRFSGESRHASNLLPDPDPKFTFPKWKIGGTSSAVSPTTEDDEDDPVFDNSFVTNVTAQLGKAAHLQCTVLNIKQSNPVRYLFFLHTQSEWSLLHPQKEGELFLLAIQTETLARRD